MLLFLQPKFLFSAIWVVTKWRVLESLISKLILTCVNAVGYCTVRYGFTWDATSVFWVRASAERFPVCTVVGKSGIQICTCKRLSVSEDRHRNIRLCPTYLKIIVISGKICSKRRNVANRYFSTCTEKNNWNLMLCFRYTFIG